MHSTPEKNFFSGSSPLERIAFYLFLTFLFFLNFSIAVCNIVFTSLVVIAMMIYVKDHKRISLPYFYRYILLFIIITLISTLFSTDFLNSLKDNKEVFIYLTVPLTLIFLDNKKKISASIKILLISAFLSAVLGIIIALTTGISLKHRLKGLTSHWMTYSGLLMIVFVFFFIYTIYEKEKSVKIRNSFLLLFIIVAIIFSLTRSAWVGIFISLGLFIIYFFRKRPVPILLALLMTVLLLLISPASVKNRVRSITDIKNVTNMDRIYMVYSAIKIAKDYPLTGVGADNVKEIYPKYRHPDATRNNPHLHNNFLQITAERGIPALIVFILFIFSVYISLIKKVKQKNGFERNISISSLFAFTAFLVSGLFEYNFGDSEIKFLLLFIITIPFIEKRKIPPGKKLRK